MITLVMTLVFLSLFVSLWSNLNWVATRLLETTNLIRCTKRFPLVLICNKPMYNLVLVLFINVGHRLFTYYSLMSSPTIPILSALNALMRVAVCSLPSRHSNACPLRYVE